MENNLESNNPKFSSQFIIKYAEKKIAEANDKNESKEISQIELSTVLSELYNYDETEIANIISDINRNNIRVAIDPDAIKILSDKNAEQQVYNKFINSINTIKEIQVSSISELSTEQLTDISSRFDIARVYVNSGYDVAAREGYSIDKYMNIKTNADLMIEAALGKNFNNKKMSQLAVFKKIYKYVVDTTKYDYGQENIQCLESRNLNHFFTKGRFFKDGKLQGKGRAVCPGIAGGLKNLCDCLGIESEYVEGHAKKSDGTTVYHSWVRVKIADKWYNVDPTWDLGRVGIIPFSFCLKTDAEFKNHEANETYIPEFHGYSAKTIIKNYYEPTAKKSLGDVMKDMYDAAYEVKYSASRQIAKVKGTINEQSNEKELSVLSESKVYANNKKLTFRQRIADFINRGKYLKRISFIKNFVDKNSTPIQKDAQLPKKEKGQGLYRTEGNLEEALSRTEHNLENNREVQSKEKDEKQI